LYCQLCWPPALPQPHKTGLPPLFDREIVFGNPEIDTPSISPDGKFIAFRKPYKDTMNIWVKRADEPFEKAKLLTAETKRPIRSTFWSRDSKYILFVNDVGGDENFNVFVVDPSASPAAGSEVPITRNLTDMKKVRALIYGVPRTEPDAMYVGLNDRDPRWHDLYKVKISTGSDSYYKRIPNASTVTGSTTPAGYDLRHVPLKAAMSKL
jgi:hypothetical protein